MADEQNDTARTELESARALILDQVSAVNAANSELADVTAERDRLHAECNQRRADFDSATTNLAEAIRAYEAACAERDEAAAELISAVERIRELETEREQLRADVRESAEVNRVLTSERDRARARRNLYTERLSEIRAILSKADHGRFGSPDVHLVEAVRLIVDDLRIVTGAADHADATVVQLNAELASARAVRDLQAERVDAIRDILADAYAGTGMPSPDDSIVESVRWVVADWRIERASNEVDHDRNRTTAAAAVIDDGPLDTWAIVELMGHRRLAGRVREVQLAGHGYLRLDIPAAGDDPARTQYIAPGSVYALHPTGEKTARAAAAHWRPEPVQRWELPGLAKPVDVDEAIADLVADEDQADEPDDMSPIVFTREDLVGGLG